MKGNGLTCGEVRRIFEDLLDGALGSRDEEALRAHLAACPACRAEYALDLALIRSIRTAPDRAFESVTGEVMGRVLGLFCGVLAGLDFFRLGVLNVFLLL